MRPEAESGETDSHLQASSLQHQLPQSPEETTAPTTSSSPATPSPQAPTTSSSSDDKIPLGETAHGWTPHDRDPGRTPEPQTYLGS